jgi:hypothetical protein
MNILYIDDAETEAMKYIEVLRKTSDTNVYYQKPPSNLDVEGEPYQTSDVILIDHLLDETHDGEHVFYRGATLAQQIREKYPEKPIVLITKENSVDEKKKQDYVRKLHLFSAFLSKSHIRENSKVFLADMQILVDGFQQLQKTEKIWEALKRLLEPQINTKEQQEDKFQELALSDYPHFANAWNVADIALWLQEVIIYYPGILYDPLYAATYLGISKEEFLSERIQNLFTTAKYNGPFSPTEGRWWRHDIMLVALNLMAQAEIDTGSVNRNFAKAFLKVYNQSLSPAVCYFQREPVRIEKSLSYYPDNRPQNMDIARVSFKEIQEDNNLDELLLDESSRNLLESIRS